MGAHTVGVDPHRRNLHRFTGLGIDPQCLGDTLPRAETRTETKQRPPPRVAAVFPGWLGAPGEIRTHTTTILSRPPLPVGLRGRCTPPPAGPAARSCGGRPVRPPTATAAGLPSDVSSMPAVASEGKPPSGATGIPVLRGAPSPDQPATVPPPEATQLEAARSKSAFGSWICPIDTTSRRNRSARVQSISTRALRLKVGILLTWYVRCMNHARKPLALNP